MASYAYKNFEALNSSGSFFDVGCNLFIDAHNAKITAQYSSRPLFDPATKLTRERKGELTVQFQVAL